MVGSAAVKQGPASKIAMLKVSESVLYGVTSPGRVSLRSSPLVMIDAPSRIPVVYLTIALTGTHEQGAFADSSYTFRIAM